MVSTLVTDTPASALAVYAHPDDPEISSGGTLARWAAAGAQVWVLITLAGDKGTDDPDADLEALARTRVEETASREHALLGLAGHFHLDHADGELVDDRQLRGEIVRHVRRLRPEVVLCPDPTAVFFADSYFNHRDHRVTGWATLDAVAPAAGNPHYFPEHRDEGLDVHHVRSVFLSGTLEPNCWIDITDDARAEDRRALLPREPAHAHRRVVPRVPPAERGGGGSRRRRALRRGVPPAHLRDLIPSVTLRGPASVPFAFHSDIARSTSTATIPTPAAAAVEPRSVPSSFSPSQSPVQPTSASP